MEEEERRLKRSSQTPDEQRLQRLLLLEPVYESLGAYAGGECQPLVDQALALHRREVALLRERCPSATSPVGAPEESDEVALVVSELADQADQAVLEYGAEAEELAAVAAEKAEVLSRLRREVSRGADQRDYWLEPGYRLERVVSGLTYPTSLLFDPEGGLYVVEGGFAYGPAKGPARILKVEGTRLQVVVDDLNGPVTGALWHRGNLYIAEGGFPGRITRVAPDGGRTHLVTGLLTQGDHYTSELAMGPDGHLYFGVGVTTNSGVVGRDNFVGGWLPQYPDRHDVPARDLVLAAVEFPDLNWLAADPGAVRVVTGAYKPFGTPAWPGEVVKGRLLANGVIYRLHPEGSNLEVVADGFRNVFGLGFDPDGRLLAVNHGFDTRGSRPISNDWDSVWAVLPGGWYGWPDFASGLPVTAPRFRLPGLPQPRFVLLNHPPLAGQPLLRLPSHSASMKFSFSPGEAFGFPRQMFLAQWGHASPATAAPQELRDTPGFRVVRANLASGQSRDFYHNLRPGQGGRKPERPIDVKFDPGGRDLYLLDFGLMEAIPGNIIPHAGTGGLWRIRRQ